MKLDRMDNAEVKEGQLGVISEDTKSHGKDMKVVVDQRINCVPKNYKMDPGMRDQLFESNKPQVKEISAQNMLDYEPLLYSIREERAIEDETQRKPAFSSQSARAPKRVGLGFQELQAALFSLFQQRCEFKLQDLVDTLNHPVNPLKNALKTICAYDPKRKVYRLKDEFITK